jgi:hypothetical protein
MSQAQNETVTPQQQTEHGGRLRVWHIANAPRPPFRVDVATIDEAKQVLRALADFDNYVGDDQPWTTVGGRRDKMRALTKDLRLGLRARLRGYEAWLLERCPGGVPLVAMNVQGLEQWVANEDTWEEYHDDDDRDIAEIMAEEKT